MAARIVVIGNGIAAVTAVKTIRENDKESEIHMFGEEAFYPYNRIRLSKGLLDTLEEDNILLQKKEWYHENNIILHKGVKITGVNTEEKTVTADNGSLFNYTKLLLATGASNFTPPIPGIKKEGVFTLRTLQDAWHITEYVKDKACILNIGGGIQGLETAWILSQMGKKVIIAELQPRLMPKQLDEKASKILEKAVKNSNIDVLTNVQINEIMGDNAVSGFKTSNGETHPCDMVLYSAGIRPNIEALQETSLQINKGLTVNEKMETTVEGIYAAGDAAAYHGEIYGLWNIAIAQGKIAGNNMIGRQSEYEPVVPVTTLNAFKLSLFSMGSIDETDAEHILLEEHEEAMTYKKIYFKNNRIIGAIVIGDIKLSPILKTAIEKETDLSDVDFSQMAVGTLLETIKNKR